MKKTAIIHLNVECYPVYEQGNKINPDMYRELSQQILLGTIEFEDFEEGKTKIEQEISKAKSYTENLRK